MKSRTVSIEPSRSAWGEVHCRFVNDSNREDGSFYSQNSLFKLYPDDFESLNPKTLVLGSIMDAIFALVSDALLTGKGKKVFLFPSSFLNHVDKDFTLKNSLHGQADLQYLVAPVFFNMHWSLWLIDVQQRKILYLDPLCDFVSKQKVSHDIGIAKKIIWYILEQNELNSDVPNYIEGWEIVRETTFEIHTGKKLPLQQEGGNDCGIYVTMYLFYYLFAKDFDFFPGDMIQIRRWITAALVTNVPSPKYSTWLKSCRKSGQVNIVQLKVKYL